MAGLLGNVLRGAGQGALNTMAGVSGDQGLINPGESAQPGGAPTAMSPAHRLLSMLLQKIRKPQQGGAGQVDSNYSNAANQPDQEPPGAAKI